MILLPKQTNLVKCQNQEDAMTVHRRETTRRLENQEYVTTVLQTTFRHPGQENVTTVLKMISHRLGPTNDTTVHRTVMAQQKHRKVNLVIIDKNMIVIFHHQEEISREPRLIGPERIIVIVIILHQDKEIEIREILNKTVTVIIPLLEEGIQNKRVIVTILRLE